MAYDPRKNEMLAEVFEDTQRFITENQVLKDAQKQSMRSTVFYKDREYPDLPEGKPKPGEVRISKDRTF